MSRVIKKHVLVCIICLKRVEVGKVENSQISFRNSNSTVRTPGSVNKDDPLLDDFSERQEDGKEEEPKEERGKTNLYRRFLQFVNQYFKLRIFTDRLIACAKDAKSEDGTPAELETFCESCGDLVSEICGLYKQLKSAELLLVWRLGQVGQLIRKSKSPMTYKLKKELWTLMAKQMNLNVASPVNLFRKTLRVKCIHAAMRSLPDVTVHKGLFPDEWKFTYTATKQALIRLIVVFILGSSQLRSKPIKASIDATVNKNDGMFGKQKPCPMSKKKRIHKPIAVKNKPGNDDADAITENVDDENEMPDILGNQSDSDWSQGAAAASPMSACSDLASSDGHETTIKTRRRTLRKRRSIIVKAEEDGDTSSGYSDSDNNESTLKLRKGRQRPTPAPPRLAPSKPIKSDGKREIKCPHCPFLFKQRSGLGRHLSVTHRTEIYHDCNKCGMRFKGKRLLLLHSKVHVPNTCKRSRGRPSGYRSAKHWPCPKCSEVFPTKIQMLHHHKSEHKRSSKWHECPYCFKKISRETSYKIHMLKHEQKSMMEEEVDIWYCEVCGMQFFKEENLKVHMNKSHEDKYICAVCNKKLDTGILLRDHLITHHETEGDKLFQCHICLKGFATKQFCDIHRKLAHMDKWKFVCDFGRCNGIFDVIPEFNEHLKSHLNEQHDNIDDDDDGDGNDKTKKKILFCKTCEMGFLKECSLTLHELLHTPASESRAGYDCPKCDKNLRYRETLFAHYNAMHGEKTKPFQCGVCGKYLSNARWFRAHVRLHEERLSTGKFICDICGIRCVDSIGLSAHRLNHEYNPERTKIKDAKFPIDLGKGRKRMKLILRQTELDVLMDPASPPPPGAKKTMRKKPKGNTNPEPQEIKEKAKELNLHVRLSCDAENCGIIFESAYLLRKHLENEHECQKSEIEKSIPCYYCYKKFFYLQSRELHVRTEHKGKIYGKFKCDSEICEEEAFLSVEELNDHLKTHLELEPHSGEAGSGITEISFCEKCDWGFARPEIRDLHQLGHIPPDNFGRMQCPLCSMTYDQNFMQYHYNNVHGDKVTEHRCNLCGKFCISKTSLRSHKQWHIRKRFYKPDPEKQLTCFKCDIKFEDNAILKAHVKELHPDNYLTCGAPGCGEGFTNKKLLWAHTKSKHKIRSFICDLCGMAFYNHTHLAGHMTTHKPKSVACDVCGKLFRREKHLERHKEKHNPNRSQDFVCSVCGKTFFAQGGLTYHFDSTHKPQSEWHLKCPKCPRRFYRSTLMHLHTKKCNGNEENSGDGGGNAEFGSSVAGNSSRKRGQRQPRKGGGRQKKTRVVESDEEDEEMEDKSTTEDEDETKPSTSNSSQTPILSSSYQYQHSQMWTGQNSSAIPPVQVMLQGHDGLANFPPMLFNQQQLHRRQDM